MGDYAECLKIHRDLGGKTDGCQKFMDSKRGALLTDECMACGCHRNFHRKVVKYETQVVYTKCHKIHEFKSGGISVDGCQEYIHSWQTECASCGCEKGFHEVTKEVTDS